MDNWTGWIDWIKENILESKAVNIEAKNLIWETKNVLLLLDNILKSVVSNCAWAVSPDLENEMDINKDKIVQLLEKINITTNDSLLNNSKIEKHLVDAESSIRVFHEQVNRDTLTWLYNLEYYNKKIELLIREWLDFHFIFFDINDLWLMNNKYGHNRGDDLLFEFAKNLRLLFWEEKNDVFRLHWDEFVILSKEKKEDSVSKINKMYRWLENRMFEFTHEWAPVSHHIKFAYWITEHKWWTKELACDIKDRADSEMYKNKFEVKNNI